jgi:hypothetical protein
MTAASFEYLITTAFGLDNAQGKYLLKLNLYENFIEAEDNHRTENKPGYDENLAFTFERLRLGIGASLIQVFASLTDDPGSPKVVELLFKALKAKNVEEIDKVMHEGVAIFENLYSDVFINPAREKVLGLFEKNLEADSRPSINAILREALSLLDEINFSADHD